MTYHDSSVRQHVGVASMSASGWSINEVVSQTISKSALGLPYLHIWMVNTPSALQIVSESRGHSP